MRRWIAIGLLITLVACSSDQPTATTSDAATVSTAEASTADTSTIESSAAEPPVSFPRRVIRFGLRCTWGLFCIVSLVALREGSLGFQEFGHAWNQCRRVRPGKFVLTKNLPSRLNMRDVIP